MKEKIEGGRVCARCCKNDSQTKRAGRKERARVERDGGRCNERQRTGVEVADAIRRQCWRIAASSSGHNEPIRLYFYFRHAAYRAIPSRAEAATATLRATYTRVPCGPRTRRHACYTYSGYKPARDRRRTRRAARHATATPCRATLRPLFLRGPNIACGAR